MRRLRYNVAMSLDGFIAGPNGEYDWIVFDAEMDFGEMYREFDTIVMGRLTYETMLERGMSPKSMGMKAVVVSTTLDPADHRDVTIVSGGVVETIAAMKAELGKDIWLCGGAVLFRSLLDAGLVDSVEPAVIPVMLGSGVPLMPAGSRCRLLLAECRTLPSSGTLILKYLVARAAAS